MPDLTEKQLKILKNGQINVDELVDNIIRQLLESPERMITLYLWTSSFKPNNDKFKKYASKSPAKKVTFNIYLAHDKKIDTKSLTYDILKDKFNSYVIGFYYSTNPSNMNYFITKKAATLSYLNQYYKNNLERIQFLNDTISEIKTENEDFLEIYKSI